MSHRTDALPKLTGIKHLVREMRYHEFSRQSIGIILVSIFCYFSPLEPIFPFQIEAGYLIAIIGLMIRLIASGYVLKNKELSTTGPYSYVRHPLYTGNLILLIGLAIINGLWWSFFVGFLFAIFYYPTAIEYEDRKLKQLFPDDWPQWSSKTPALWPKINAQVPNRGLSFNEWSFSKSLKSNYEPVIVIYVLAWLTLLSQR